MVNCLNFILYYLLLLFSNSIFPKCVDGPIQPTKHDFVPTHTIPYSHPNKNHVSLTSHPRFVPSILFSTRMPSSLVLSIQDGPSHSPPYTQPILLVVQRTLLVFRNTCSSFTSSNTVYLSLRPTLHVFRNTRSSFISSVPKVCSGFKH